MPNKHLLKKFYKIFVPLLFLIIFSFGANLYYGYRGVFPIDTLLHFDSAYNILNNNHPIKDFFSITGIFVDYLQAIFFYFFGVNWFGYIIHAATLNCLLSIVSFILFNNLGLSKSYSFLYSAEIAAIAYTSVGSPFVDFHGIVFSLLSVYFFIFSIIKKNNIFWFFIPLFLLFSFLSKQIPAAYIIIFLSMLSLLYFINNFQLKKIFFLFLGCVTTIIFFYLYLFLFNINFSDFVIQYLLFPLSIGKSRFDILDINFFEIINNFKFIFLIIVPLLFLNIKIFLNKKNNDKNLILIINCILGTAIIFIYSQLFTKNQILIFFLIPVLMAVFHSYYFLIFKKKYLLFFMFLVTFFSVVKYHFRYNENKYFMDFRKFEIKYSSEGEKIDKIFYGLKWVTPFEYYKKSSEEVFLLKQTKDFINLDTNKNEVIFITDYLFFSAITKHKIPSPIKWYDSVIIPNKNNKYYNYYKSFFIGKILQNNIKNIYLIGDKDKNIFFDLVVDKKCISSKKINNLFSVYNIANCKFIL